MQFPLQLKTFLISSFHFWNLHQVLNFFQKKFIAVATLLRNLQAVKDLVRPISKKQCFRTHSDSQHVKESQTVVKSA